MIEALVVGFVLALAFAFVAGVVAAVVTLMRFCIALVLLPFKLVGWVIGGACSLALAAVLVALLAPLIVLLALVALPVFVVGALLAQVIRLAA